MKTQNILLTGICIAIAIAIILALQKPTPALPVAIKDTPVTLDNNPAKTLMHSNKPRRPEEEIGTNLPPVVKGFVRGVPWRESKHMSVLFFLASNAKDNYVGQTIMLELIKNGCAIENAPYIYANLRTLQQSREKGLMANHFKTRYATGYDGNPPITNTALLDRLFELKPTEPYWPNTEPPHMSGKLSDDQYKTEKDILKYIQEHPAPAPVQSGPILPAPGAQ